ncbi:alpha/beta hydrolase fold domain-containing protein [Flagellimonas olearia]|nr:alpha/beta hydrolase fold domain-containing protein [Allomuricauda olearia]
MEATISKEELKQTRTFFNSLGAIYPPSDGVTVDKERINGIVTYTFSPQDAKQNKILLYAHGGSFALGGIESHKAFMSHFAKNTHTKIILVAYGLAPEYPYPHGIKDFKSVYQEVCTRNKEKSIFVGGDSAGGAIVVSFIHELEKDNLSQPDGVILISPWLNLNCNTESYVYNKDKDPILTKTELKKYAVLYAGREKINVVAPSNLSFSTFPPCLVMVGKNEILYDDGRNFAKTIKGIQPNSDFLEFEEVTHVWPLTNISSRPTQKLFKKINGFLNH